MAKNKISRKKLLKEPDEFLTVSARMLRFVIEHKTQVSAVIGIIFVVLAVGSLVQYFSEKSENQAVVRLQRAIEKYETAIEKYETEFKDKEPKQADSAVKAEQADSAVKAEQADSAVKADEADSDAKAERADSDVKAYSEVKADFDELIQKYSTKKGGKIARIEYAHICYQAGKYDEAIKLYESALVDFETNPSLRNIINTGLGYAYEGKQDYDNAVKYFEAVASDPDAMMKDTALFNAGRIYAKMGKDEKSKEAYSKLVEGYKDSIYYDLVKDRVPQDKAAG